MIHSPRSLFKEKKQFMKFSGSLKFNHIFQRLYHSRGVSDGYLALYARKNRTDRSWATQWSATGRDAACEKFTGSMRTGSSRAAILWWWPAVGRWRLPLPI